MVQTPAPASETEVLETVQTAGVREVKLTVRPDVAVAEMTKGAAPKTLSASAPKLIVWLEGVTRKLASTGLAGKLFESPACVASIVQVPEATNVTVDPATVQMGVVREAKLTARPEVAVALTVNGALPNAILESGPKLMVWLARTTWKDWLTVGAAL